MADLLDERRKTLVENSMKAAPEGEQLQRICMWFNLLSEQLFRMESRLLLKDQHNKTTNILRERAKK